MTIIHEIKLTDSGYQNHIYFNYTFIYYLYKKWNGKYKNKNNRNFPKNKHKKLKIKNNKNKYATNAFANAEIYEKLMLMVVYHCNC